MRYDSRSSVESEVSAILRRNEDDQRRQVGELTELVLKAYEEGERDGKKRERRKHSD